MLTACCVFLRRESCCPYCTTAQKACEYENILIQVGIQSKIKHKTNLSKDNQLLPTQNIYYTKEKRQGKTGNAAACLDY